MQLPLYLRKALMVVFFLLLLGLTLWLRIHGTDTIPDGQFTENDAYLYQRQAGIIAAEGWLPERDMHRWLPVGRDNGQLLPLYAYAIGYLHKAFPVFSLYTVQFYAPVFCFTIGLCVLVVYLRGCYGLCFAAIVGVILTTLPGSIERSAAGFGDRDAWCWMLGALALTSYLGKDALPSGWRRYLVIGISGFLVFLGGMSWEGFGFFLLIILSVEIWQFCVTDTQASVKDLLLWIMMFVPCLYLVSPAYRSGYGFSTHLSALIIAPPLIVLTLWCLRQGLLRYVDSFKAHARKLTWGLMLSVVCIGMCYIYLEYDQFETTAFAFRESRLMSDVSELTDPFFAYWIGRYGAIFLLGSIGFIVGVVGLWKWHGLFLAVSLGLFTATTFFREPVSGWIGNHPCNVLFWVSLGVIICGLGVASFRKTPTAEDETVWLAMLTWYVLWVGLSRGGVRYDFFIGAPLAYGTAWLLWHLPTSVLRRTGSPRYLRVGVKTVMVVVLGLIMFWDPTGGHANRAKRAATQWRAPFPGQGNPLSETLEWMQTHISENSVVAASWSYGSLINVLGGSKTIIDPDHYLPHWVHLFYRHVFSAQSEDEALSYLKTHGATHLMLTRRGVYHEAWDLSYIGSDATEDRKSGLIPLVILPDIEGRPKRVANPRDTPLLYIDTPVFNAGEPRRFLTARLKNQRLAQLPFVAFRGDRIAVRQTSIENEAYGGVILFYDTDGTLEKSYYVPSMGWRSLWMRLFFLGDYASSFLPVYPIKGFDTAAVKIWQIRYPPEIQTDAKYLATSPENKGANKKD